MSGLMRAHHRLSLALASVVVATMAILLLAIGDASGRGIPPIGNGEGGVELDEVGDGTFDSPVNVAFAPGEPNLVYVVEQGGVVEVLQFNSEQLEPFLDIQNLTDPSGEQGLLAIAFHPAYPAKPFVYAYYTNRRTGDIVVAEFEAPDPLDADESSRRKVIRIRHRFASNHNGGQLLFGPDDRLYMGTGDGGAAGDPRENAQNKRSLLGKILRINPLDPPGRRDYTTPKSNPFKGRKGRDEILARGLRNPFRFSFDDETGRIAIGDVGQDSFEEVDYETRKGLRNANFGWDRFEGKRRLRFPGDNESRRPKRRQHDKPVHVYPNAGANCSVTGGVVVRDTTLENLYGRYLYADFCAGLLRSFIPTLRRAEDEKALDGETFEAPTSFTTSPHTLEVYVTGFGPMPELGTVKVIQPIGP